MKLFYIENATWEYDFIKNDIFCDFQNLEFEFFKSRDLSLLLERPEITKNCILVVSEVCDSTEIINVVKHVQPIITFYLSDERGVFPNITEMDKYTKLVFRQHTYHYYNYSTNNYHLVLGYVTHFLKGRNSLALQQKKMNKRKFNCSFIGANKSDRLEMANVFQKNMEKTNIVFVENNWNIPDLNFSPDECFEIYNDSIFVLSGRGNFRLDCFRIYEAIVAGAIPVVTGPVDEIHFTFNYNNSIPPFVYADSFDNALIKCKELLGDFEKLQKMQDELLEWWTNQITFIKELIKKEMNTQNTQNTHKL